eukprot:21218-Eustigmatos_ZCMA.PRE.1
MQDLGRFLSHDKKVNRSHQLLRVREVLLTVWMCLHGRVASQGAEVLRCVGRPRVALRRPAALQGALLPRGRLHRD